ncbi:MAG: hypothetical protein EHM48_03120 [Planctomycetaceae bacterium]|nr:MAG: hypothetical protein EHM48_03120 [Planctomycetaceae bacterium]
MDSRKITEQDVEIQIKRICYQDLAKRVQPVAKIYLEENADVYAKTIQNFETNGHQCDRVRNRYPECVNLQNYILEVHGQEKLSDGVSVIGTMTFGNVGAESFKYVFKNHNGIMKLESVANTGIYSFRFEDWQKVERIGLAQDNALALLPLTE